MRFDFVQRMTPSSPHLCIITIIKPLYSVRTSLLMLHLFSLLATSSLTRLGCVLNSQIIGTKIYHSVKIRQSVMSSVRKRHHQHDKLIILATQRFDGLISKSHKRTLSIYISFP